MTVTAVDPHRSSTVEAESSGVRYVTGFEFRAAPDGGTDAVMSFGGEATGVLSRVLGAITAPIVRRSMHKVLTADLADLAAAAEAR